MSLLAVRAFPYWAEGSWPTAESSRRGAAAVSLFGCKETSFHQGHPAEGEVICYSRSPLFVLGCPGHYPVLVAPLPLPLASSMSVLASQVPRETDSTHWPGRKLTWQKSELFAPGLMNWISSVKALMNINLMQEKGCASMAGMKRRKGRARAWDMLLLAVMNCESDSTLTCNFPRGLLVRDHETGTPFSRSCTIACHYHKQPVACVLKQEIPVHTQDSQINSEAEQSTWVMLVPWVKMLLQGTPKMQK